VDNKVYLLMTITRKMHYTVLEWPAAHWDEGGNDWNHHQPIQIYK